MYSFKRIFNKKVASFCARRKSFFPNMMPEVFKVNEEVLQSLNEGLPVVALESTVITHGLPYPQNLETACKLENIVRENCAMPATIGVIDGRIHVGMKLEELKRLSLKDKGYTKISRRDFPYALSKKLTGGTTVAGTMVIAHMCGIPIFATGGIGGVHRGGETSMDISADLYELSQTPMTVVSAGVKSILDIGRTLEYLETLGVCVASFGQTKNFPAFFTPNSGFKSVCSVASYQEAANLIDSRDSLNLKSGVLLAVPIPDSYAQDGYLTEAVIEEALKDASDQKIRGKDVTPFVLNRVVELSNGASLRANIGLLENNALVGSRIAIHLSELKKQRSPTGSSRVMQRPASAEAKKAFSSRPVSMGILEVIGR